MPTGYTEIINFLRGGLNTALDPSNIGDDQLQEATGMEYRPPRAGLFAVQGRSSFGTWANGGNNMYGLVFAQFDVSATSVEGHRLIGFTGTSAIGASANAQTGTFATVKRDFTAAVTSFADGVHYGNDWFFWNGTDPSWSILHTNLQASAQHGLFSVTAAPTCVATALATAYQNSVGTFECWLTEYIGDEPSTTTYAEDVEPRLESSFESPTVALSSVQIVTLSATGLGIKVTFPAAQENPDTSVGNIYWRFYASIADGKYPFGFARGSSGVTGVGGDTRASSHLSASTGPTTHIVPKDSVDEAFTAYQSVQPPDGVSVSRNDPPPTPYDMAVFQDSIVAIDASDRQIIRYSEPDLPHYFPSVNFIPFETEEQDQLTALEVCNNALLVFSSWYGFRVDDLPRATDGDNIFAGRSRAKEPFSHHHGCVSPVGTAVFDIYGSGQLCAFVCRDGLHITDGFKTDYMSIDLDWETTVNISLLDRARLLNNPKRHRVEFYYPDFASASDAYIWKRLDFYYHPAMLDENPTHGFPKLPMLGPTNVPGPAATLGVFSGDWRVFCGSDFSPTAWFEGTGTVDNAQLVDASGTINKRWRTKDWYHAGQGGEFEVERVYLAQAQTTASGTYTVTAYSRTDDLGTYNSTATVDQSDKGNQPILGLGQTRAQSMSLRGAKDDGGAWQEVNYLVWVVKDKQRLMSAKSSV